eukprot:6141218-Amphidinium_carterae.1
MFDCKFTERKGNVITGFGHRLVVDSSRPCVLTTNQNHETKTSWQAWDHTLHRENTSDHQDHSEQKNNKKFQEHRYTPKYWKIKQNGVHQGYFSLFVPKLCPER